MAGHPAFCLFDFQADWEEEVSIIWEKDKYRLVKR
jgi:hypothetical protein